MNDIINNKAIAAAVEAWMKSESQAAFDENEIVIERLLIENGLMDRENALDFIVESDVGPAVGLQFADTDESSALGGPAAGLIVNYATGQISAY